MQIDGFDGRANGVLFFFQESESLPMHYDLSLFVICVECCRRVQISWVYFAARMQSWFLSFCFEGSELAIIGRLFSIRLLLVYPRTRPSKTSSCRWECTSSSTRQKVFAIWDKQNAIQHLLDYFCVIVQIGWFALHWQRLRNIRKDCTRLERIGKEFLLST